MNNEFLLQVQSLRKDGYSRKQIANELGVTEWRVRCALSRLFEDTSERPGDAPRKWIDPQSPIVRSDIIRKLRGGWRGLKSLAEEFNCHPATMRDIVNHLEERGYNVLWDGDRVRIMREAKHAGRALVDGSPIVDEWREFGFITDTHLCSRFERLDVLEAAYDEYAKRGISCVYHGGNIVDGEWDNNRYELKAHGITDQALYCLDHYPQRRDITTYYITGSCHEGWWLKREGIDFGRYLQFEARDRGRDDLVYLGFLEADIVLRSSRGNTSNFMRLFHPGGGSSYAISYVTQKIVESLSGGEKPSLMLVGHFHKSMYHMVRNVHVIQGGCFSGNTYIETKTGRKKIKDVEVGDLVLTHKNRYRKVTRTFKRKHRGGSVRLSYGGKERGGCYITATPEHPILVERNNIWAWITFQDVMEGDLILTKGSTCTMCGNAIPHFLRFCNRCSPTSDAKIREKISRAKGGFKKRRSLKKISKTIHLERDILPFCREMSEKGWKIVPVDTGLIPDAIGFKDGRVVAFELERAKYRMLQFKKDKYMDNPINEFIDNVEWIDVGGGIKEQFRTEYEVDDDSGFVKMRVSSKQVREKWYPSGKRDYVTVYNLEVEEDNSYIAGRCVVHNCTQDQSTYMRKRRIEAHVGFWTVRIQQDTRGAIRRIEPTFTNFYDRSYHKIVGEAGI